MPKGPKGEKRPADVIGNAVHVMKIATGEVEEPTENMSPECRAEIAQEPAKKRWGKGPE